MDTPRGFDEDWIDTDVRDSAPVEDDDPGVHDLRLEIGVDERRMHVRAYNHWVSLLQGRAYPSIENLDPANIADFGPHSVLLDFSNGVDDPAIAYLGRALREECGLDSSITHIAQVPSRSLLSRLTDHYLQIIANRAPIGFEAEFVATRGFNTMYRGILMPFSSDEDTIDFIYGVINWKELVDTELQAKLAAEIDEAVRTAPRSAPAASAWADGPSAEMVEETAIEPDTTATFAASLSDQLMLAQQTAAAVRAADTRSRATLYRALGRAHDFAIAAATDEVGYAGLLGEAGIVAQARAPMTPIAKLVFGADYDKTRLTEYAAVLAHAERACVARGELTAFLDGFAGGIKGVVKAERAVRRPAPALAKPPCDIAALPTLASVSIESNAAIGDYIVLLARAGASGDVEIVANLAGNKALTERALKAV